MKKLLSFSFAFFISAISNSNYAQDSLSIQISTGIIMPRSASNGFNAAFQFNYDLSKNIQLYFYSGYYAWDKYYINFIEDWSVVQQKTRFQTNNADNHILLPVYIGSRINIHTNDLFTSFVIFELGYSYYSYNAYSVNKGIDSSTGEVISFYPDINTKRKVTENLFGLGTGFGLSHPITDNIEMVLSLKLNSQLNSKEYSFLSSKGTYTVINMGIVFNL